MLKQPASFVLASLRGSTCRGEPLGYRILWRGFSVRQDPFNGRTAHTKCGMYLLASSLAATLPAERRVLARRGWAGENRGLFEHLAGATLVVPDMRERRDVNRLDFHLVSPVQPVSLGYLAGAL